MSIGNRIERIRKELRLTQTEFATRAKIWQDAISEAESGKRTPGLKALTKIAQTYGISLNWLVLEVGPIWLKDNQLPLRGDALDIYRKQIQSLSVPGLADFINNEHLMDKVEPTGQEIASLIDATKGPTAWTTRDWSKRDWLRGILTIRRERIRVIEELMSQIEDQPKEGKS